MGWLPLASATLFLGGSSVAKLGAVVPATVWIDAKRSSLAPSIVDAKRARFLGAWTLTSGDESFGGLSAITRRNGEMLAVSDDGTFYQFAVAEGKPRWKARRFGLPVACGPRDSKKDHDTESLAQMPDGSIWVGLEWRNRLCRMVGADLAKGHVVTPAALKTWPRTGGAEAMVALPDGRLAVFAERPKDEGPISPILVFAAGKVTKDAKPLALKFRPPAGFRVSDAGILPDGRLLVLVRSFSAPFTFESRLLLVNAPEWTAGKTLEGQEIIRLATPGIHDNFEAIVLGDAGDGGNQQGWQKVWLASDDNHLPLQKTWLLKVEVKAE
jgi:hypothetical protein